MGKLRGNLTYANVMSTIAAIVAVAGGTTAVAGKSKAPKNSVTSKSIQNGAVTAKDLSGIRVVVGPLSDGSGGFCDANEKLIGGGGRVMSTGGGGSTPTLNASHPAPDGASWVVNGFTGDNLQAYALCLKAKPEK